MQVPLDPGGLRSIIQCVHWEACLYIDYRLQHYHRDSSTKTGTWASDCYYLRLFDMGLVLPGNSAEILEHDSRLHYTLPGFLVLHNNQKYLCLQVRSAQYLSLDRALDRISGSTFYPFWDSVFLIIEIQHICILKCCAYHAFYRFARSFSYG